MNIKSIASLTLAAAAVALTSVAPAMAANNNNVYLNNLAMQMYAQNQAAANVNSLNSVAAAQAVYGNGPTPWSAGAICTTPAINNCNPLGYTAYNVVQDVKRDVRKVENRLLDRHRVENRRIDNHRQWWR